MGIIYNLIHKKKDIALRNEQKYLDLINFGYLVSDLDNSGFGLTYEKYIDEYFCHIYLTQRKVVFTVFFELDEILFKEKFKTLEKLFDKYAWAGRDFLEDRISLKSLSTTGIDSKMKELIAVVKANNFPPLSKENINYFKKEAKTKHE